MRASKPGCKSIRHHLSSKFHVIAVTMWVGLCSWLVFATSHTCHAGPGEPTLQRYQSRHYTIHTNLPKEDVAFFGRHMDTVYDLYARKFKGFSVKHDEPMPLYLLQTEADYHTFLATRGITAANSGGLFFVRPPPHGSGLAIFVRDRNRNQTLATLQHEGFHQFAWRHIGPDLPIWANEGIAQYFEDGLVIDRQIVLGRGDPYRISLIKNAVKQDQFIAFHEFLRITHQQWAQTLNQNPQLASIYYAQAWSIVDMLVNSGRADWRKRFVDYLKRVSAGQDSEQAFFEAYATKSQKRNSSPESRRKMIETFAQKWTDHVRRLKPDTYILAIQRIEFLGSGLAFLHRNRASTPHSITDLRRALQRIGYYTVRSAHGLSHQSHSSDEAMYRYDRPRRGETLFRLLEPARQDLPPRITAPGLQPEPTLTWLRENGELIYRIDYR